uniref:Uncharacterized protein n=1 Tax=Acanthochromis polyacanthus TaxID=80966 RepID=A0A3Q1G6H3_9TELE
WVFPSLTEGYQQFCPLIKTSPFTSPLFQQTCLSPSQAWNVLALDGSNWQKIDLFNFQTDIEGRVVENISKRCGGFLRQLSLRGCLSVGDASMKTFAQNCRNIEVLNLNGCTKITDKSPFPSVSHTCTVNAAFLDVL